MGTFQAGFPAGPGLGYEHLGDKKSVAIYVYNPQEEGHQEKIATRYSRGSPDSKQMTPDLANLDLERVAENRTVS